MTGMNDQPEEILEMKGRLLNHITHEFLTPLNLILTPLEQLLTFCENPDHQKIISMVYRNSQRLLLFVSQVLELLKLESKKLKLKAHRQNIVTFLKGIAASFELPAGQQEVELIFESDKENISIYFDTEKMAEVMCNLVMNAFKYTPPGGQVSLSVRELPSGPVEISLYNTGREIPIDEMRLIFDHYYQLNKEFEHYTKGFGIGLYLAREYVKLHHGTIDVIRGADKGTGFVIRLLKGKAHLKTCEISESPVSHASEEGGCKISKRYAYMMQLEREEKEKNRPVNGESSSIEKDQQEGDIVLVIEDNTDMRGFIKSLLTSENFIVEEVDNGKQGIKMAKEIVPDIIISDIMMPDMDGYQVCRELKGDIETSHIPLILLSVKHTEEEIVQGLEAGADDYVTKPFKMNILLTRIRNLIKIRRRLQQRVQLETVTHPDELQLSALDDKFLKKVTEAIEQSLSDPAFGHGELADSIAMSRASLYRKITSLSGQSPGKFIRAYRLKRSVDLLKSDYSSITDVAFKVGFSNAAYFTKCFKEKFGSLPSAFR